MHILNGSMCSILHAGSGCVAAACSLARYTDHVLIVECEETANNCKAMWARIVGRRSVQH